MELAEIKQFLALPDEIDSLDKFKEHFNSSYISKDKAHLDDEVKRKATGDVIRRISSKVANELGDFGIKTTDFEGKPFEEVISVAAQNAKQKIQELTESQGKPDKRYQDLETQFSTLKQERDQYKTKLDETVGTFESFKAQKENEVKTWKVGIKLQDVRSKVPFVDGLTDIQRKGFESVLGEYQFDLDDKDELIVKDKNGNFVPSKQKAGAFADAYELMDTLAEANGLKKKNNAKEPERKTVEIHKEESNKKVIPSAYKRNLERYK